MGLLVLGAQYSIISIRLWRRFVLKVGREIILGWAWTLWVGGTTIRVTREGKRSVRSVEWGRGSRLISTWLGNGGLVGLTLLGERMSGACLDW
ncbi:hypothetical protein ACSQ67_003041 [Phaseolus vulgaris]